MSCLDSPKIALKSYYTSSSSGEGKKKKDIDFAKFVHDYLKLVPKYQNFPVFSKFPFLATFESDIEKYFITVDIKLINNHRWLFGLDAKDISVNFRDFLSKCLEVNIHIFAKLF